MKRLIVLLIIVIAPAFYVYHNFSSVAARTAEKIASDALGVAVHIGAVDVSFSDKKVIVDTIEIDNPPGYRKTHSVTAESISIGLNTASKKLIDFKDVRVKGSAVNLEVNEKGMNLMDLKELANRKKQKESVGSEQIRVIVRHMVIEASTINPSITLIDRDIAPIKMPAVTFSNIGQGSGVKAGDAVVQILSKYLTTAEKAARDSGILTGLPGYGEVEQVIDSVAKGLKDLF